MKFCAKENIRDNRGESKAAKAAQITTNNPSSDNLESASRK